MDNNMLISRSEGFVPKSFIGLPDDELLEIIESNGLLDNMDDNMALREKWTGCFQEINTDITNSFPKGFETINLTRTEIQDEVEKVSENIGNTIFYIYLNISKKDWFQRITEYFVYVDSSIGSVSGSIIYWLTLQGFLEEDGVSRLKSKPLLQFIVKTYDFIASHKFYNEINTFGKAFPYKVLQLEEYDLTNVVSLLVLYPNGVLNRFISQHFPSVPKTLSRESITQVLHGYVKSALNDFDAEKLWKKGDVNEIKNFLMESAIQKNKIANSELLQSQKVEYIDTIKKWLQSQTMLFNELINIEQLKIVHNRDQNHVADNKIPAKYYALYHKILIELKHEKDFNRLDDDRYSRKEIEQLAERRYPNINAQSFYRAFIELEDLSNKIAISRSFKSLKQKVAIISEDDPDILHYLKQFPG
ncbi:MAG: hypothetical protein KAS32_09000 [Candidatus Peribacteraceae bacterium]|nr:hypothetical protein [Candidatus Peribacteraceae bacterium]